MNLKNSIFIDCEWYLRGKIFLLSYKEGNKKTMTVYGNSLNKFPNLINKIEPKYIFVYGPDIAYLDKFYKTDLRNDFLCINVLKMVKNLIHYHCHRLACIEEYLNIKREVKKYKENIFTIWDDWDNPDLKKLIIEYNVQDVDSLYLITVFLIKKFKLNKNKILEYRLK